MTDLAGSEGFDLFKRSCNVGLAAAHRAAVRELESPQPAFVHSFSNLI